MKSGISQPNSVHKELLHQLDLSRKETKETQLRMEKQVQMLESQLIKERIQGKSLTGRITEETDRADQLQIKLMEEQIKIAALENQLQMMQQQEYNLIGKIDHEKAIKEDLERRLNSAENRVSELNQQISESMRAAVLQNELAESTKKERAAQRKAMLLFPCILTFHVGSSTGGAFIGFSIAGPIGGVIGSIAGILGSNMATQDITIN